MGNLFLLNEDLWKIKQSAPLVHNITNYVVMNNTANALLAIGASPVMAHALEEVEEMVGIASSLVLNIGTLSRQWVEAMIVAGEKAKSRAIPIIFDPVGVGATSYRNEVATEILSRVNPVVIRGNASEIMALSGMTVASKGVDSANSTVDALESAKLLASSRQCVVVVSGEQDIVTDGESTIYNDTGSAIMAKVTGMGCTASALLGAFLAVNENYLQAVVNGTVLMGKVGSYLSAKVQGSGSFQVAFIDTLYQLSAGKLSLGEL